MIRLASIGAVAFLSTALVAGLACAADPVAIVEAATGTTGVAPMDYLPAGKVIHLGAAGQLVLDYLGSCERETIAGGKVTVGTEQSKVVGGAVSREKVQCDGGQYKLGADQSNEGGVVVFRAVPGKPVQGQRTLTIYGLCPIIELDRPAHLVIERVDEKGWRLELDVAPAALVHGKFYDFALTGETLVPAGTYRATADGRTKLFAIAADAQACAPSVAGRLVGF
jgi:hypothetical protein